MDNTPTAPDRDAGEAARWLDHCKAIPQRLLPHHLLSRGMHALARSRNRLIRDGLIRFFRNRFQIDLGEAAIQDPGAFETFNAFFTRALRTGARTIAAGDEVLVSPVDATISQLGRLDGGAILQAKGKRFDLASLLGGDEARAQPFIGGDFITLYLSPRDYHRIHMPLAGTLREMVYVPGRLFSVSPATTRALPQLFARNERVALLFDTDNGPLALVLVGALFVGSIETVWAGEVTPPAGRRVRSWCYDTQGSSLRFAKGEEIGRFNMGSTVIILTGRDALRWESELRPGHHLNLGERLAAAPNQGL